MVRGKGERGEGKVWGGCREWGLSAGLMYGDADEELSNEEGEWVLLLCSIEGEVCGEFEEGGYIGDGREEEGVNRVAEKEEVLCCRDVVERA